MAVSCDVACFATIVTLDRSSRPINLHGTTLPSKSGTGVISPVCLLYWCSPWLLVVPATVIWRWVCPPIVLALVLFGLFSSTPHCVHSDDPFLVGIIICYWLS